MPIIAGRCWSRFLEFNAPISTVTIILRGLAEGSAEECRVNPKLLADLNVRCRAALKGMKDGGLGTLPGRRVAPFKYVEEPVDKWQLYSALAEHFAEQMLVADCDCLSILWAGFFKLACNLDRVGVGISQPKTRPCCKGNECSVGDSNASAPGSGRVCGHGMAHAYNVLGGEMPNWLRRMCVPYGGDEQGLYVFDASVKAGMSRPSNGFYGSGEHDLRWLRDD